MKDARTLVPLAAALLGLGGSLGATLSLHRVAASALDRVLEERLRGAGETAARLMGRAAADRDGLRAVMAANRLEGVYVLSPTMQVLADATGPGGLPADLLRVDGSRAARAFAGEPTIDFAYAVGDLRVATAYFPVRDAGGTVRAVLALEAGPSFTAERDTLRRALWVGIAVSLLGALAVGVLARRWAAGEDQRRRAAARAAQGEALARMAAMVAHEIRNPVGVIRGAVELVRERAGAALGSRDREALADALGEVERLKRLTQDFLDLAREPPLVPVPLDVAAIVREAARGLERAYPAVAVEVAVPSLPLTGDADRLRQVLGNLLLNAAQAGARRVRLSAGVEDGFARVEVADDGPGIDPALRDRLFEPFATGRRGGTGLGLSVSRRIVERHGGELVALPGEGPGATFRVTLPLAAG